MTDQRFREMELMAKLVRAHLLQQPYVAAHAAAGSPVTFGYGPAQVWLHMEGRILVSIPWINWWDAGLETRGDHAGFIARRLVREWKAQADG